MSRLEGQTVTFDDGTEGTIETAEVEPADWSVGISSAAAFITVKGREECFLVWEDGTVLDESGDKKLGHTCPLYDDEP